MAFSVVYKRSVARDLKRVSKTDIRRLLNRIENELPQTAETLPALKGEFTGLRKFRVGDYRVIFAIRDDEIVVLRIRHGKDDYEKGI